MLFVNDVSSGVDPPYPLEVSWVHPVSQRLGQASVSGCGGKKERPKRVLPDCPFLGSWTVCVDPSVGFAVDEPYAMPCVAGDAESIGGA